MGDIVVKRNNKKISYFFILIQVILYVSFLLIDFFGKDIILSSSIKFSIIILCFCYALFTKSSADKSILFCLKVGLFFTLISDLFILILDLYIYGVITFIIVQQLYGIRISAAANNHSSEERKVSILQSFMVRFAIQISVALLVYYLLQISGVKIDVLLVVSVFYFICILNNALRAMIIIGQKKMDRSFLIFTIGMVLFLLCDINVGLFNITMFVSLPEDVYQVLYSLSSILMWAFYAPAQVLITLSLTEMTPKQRYFAN